VLAGEVSAPVPSYNQVRRRPLAALSFFLRVMLTAKPGISMLVFFWLR
jgi:hypothetical protein